MLPVVFVHGLIGPFSDTRTVSLLRPAVVVSPDLLGYGAEADADPSEITIEAQVEYVRATVDRMAPDSRMHLVGHSVGGVIATSFVHRFPVESPPSSTSRGTSLSPTHSGPRSSPPRRPLR